MARKRKTRKKKEPYIISEYIINDVENRGKITPLPNSRIKIGDDIYKATSTIRGGYRYFQDGDVIVKVPERKWQELVTKTITVEDIWG